MMEIEKKRPWPDIGMFECGPEPRSIDTTIRIFTVNLLYTAP
jgi:hypothetical protein